jgi:hypothetical protein
VTLERRFATHRASRGYDCTIVCLVRDENGPVDLTGKELEVNVRAYGRNYTHRFLTIPGTQVDPGKVTFTVPATTMYSSLNETLYRIDLTADGVLVYEALLEIN